mgnify:CR=1 FL=1
MGRPKINALHVGTAKYAPALSPLWRLQYPYIILVFKNSVLQDHLLSIIIMDDFFLCCFTYGENFTTITLGTIPVFSQWGHCHTTTRRKIIYKIDWINAHTWQTIPHMSFKMFCEVFETKILHIKTKKYFALSHVVIRCCKLKRRQNLLLFLHCNN